MASKIKEWRLERGLTQREMCTILRMPRRTLEDYESEKRHPAPWVEELIHEKLLQFDTGKWPID